MLVKLFAVALLAGNFADATAPSDRSTAAARLDQPDFRADTTGAGLSGKLRGPLLSYLRYLPFSAKVNGRIGQYVIGFWPAEKRRIASGAYRNPDGFIEVTPENLNTPVSEHFR